jgi:hypothetical protein
MRVHRTAPRPLVASKAAELDLLDQLISFTLLDARRNRDFAQTAAGLIPLIAQVVEARKVFVSKAARSARIEAGKISKLQEAKAFLTGRGYGEAAEVPDYAQARKLSAQRRTRRRFKRSGTWTTY